MSFTAELEKSQKENGILELKSTTEKAKPHSDTYSNCQKPKATERILKTARDEELITCKGSLKGRANFLSETLDGLSVGRGSLCHTTSTFLYGG